MRSVDHVSPAASPDIVLMGDPRVAAVPVRECGQELVDVRGDGALGISALRADDGGAFAQTRAEVAQRLAQANRALPDGMRLLIVEAYRPPELQELYFQQYLSGLRALHPDWDAPRLRLAASRYVSPPAVAPHTAGGAVDLSLCAEDGTELDLGTRVNADPEESAGACYTDSRAISTEARHHRSVLGAALGEAGFVNYPTEWWHWSFGDRYWALVTGAPSALYGPRDWSRATSPADAVAD